MVIFAILLTYAILAGGIFYFVMETGKRSGEPMHMWLATGFVLASAWPLAALIVGIFMTVKFLSIKFKSKSIN